MGKLTVYLARENIDKDKFMFNEIQAAHEKRPPVFLLVPEQYTLQAERDAFEHMDRPGFMDFEVLSFSSLGRRILAETGYDGPRPEYISRYGKFILLSSLLYRGKARMDVFKNLEGSAAFIEKLSDFIAEMKNHGVAPDDLQGIADSQNQDSILSRKLGDIYDIYHAYESRLNGEENRYADKTDQVRLWAEKIDEATFIKNAEFWLSGYDYLSPAMRDVVIRLAVSCGDVNILLTGEPEQYFFALTTELAYDLCERAKSAGIVSICIDLGISEETPRFKKPEEIALIESALFFKGEPKKGTDGTVRLVSAPNYYAEAEAAAIAIAGLVRNEDMRYRDILVLCNDLEVRGQIIKRKFEQYGIPVFLDRRRSVAHNPATEFILALPDIAAKGRRYEDVFRMLKTGLSGISDEEICELENYVVRYDIKGRGWDRKFTWGLIREDNNGQKKGEYTQEALDSLNDSRERVRFLIDSFEQCFKKEKTASGRTDALIDFLREDVGLPEQLKEYTLKLEGYRKLDYAGEMAGVGEMVFEILGQMKIVFGDIVMPMSEYAVVLRAGFESIKLGVLPPASDQVLLGTMLRTRSGKANAVFVLGANDGVIPAVTDEEKILSSDETMHLAKAGYELEKSDESIHCEEQIAIYRNLSSPGKMLYISYSAAGNDNKDLRPSQIFTKLRRLFPDCPLETGIDEESEIPDSIQHPDETTEHLAANLRAWSQSELMPEVWKKVWHWFGENRVTDRDRLKAGLSFTNRDEKVDEAFVSGLLRRNISQSELGKYSKCSFAWFLESGLKLKEEIKAGDFSRDYGNIFHDAIMRFEQELSSDGLPVNDKNSKWNTITDFEIENLIGAICTEVESFQGGASVAGSDAIERDASMPYRSERLRRTLTVVAKTLTKQVRSGSIEKMYFETDFGRYGDFPPIEVDKDGEKIRIHGRIDRVDALAGGHARIIDYKSGSEKFSLPDVLAGWQLQLMIYLNAVGSSLKPAGVFYFKIREPHIKDDGEIDIEKAINDHFIPDGVYINDPEIVSLLGDETIGKRRGAAMNHSDFNALVGAASEAIQELCSRLASGRAAAEPLQAIALRDFDNNRLSACTYCDYKGICNFDEMFRGISEAK